MPKLGNDNNTLKKETDYIYPVIVEHGSVKNQIKHFRLCGPKNKIEDNV